MIGHRLGSLSHMISRELDRLKEPTKFSEIELNESENNLLNYYDTFFKGLKFYRTKRPKPIKQEIKREPIPAKKVKN